MTQFIEILEYQALGVRDDATAPTFDVPYSVEFDDSVYGNGGSFDLASKSQTNGGIQPALDLALEFSAEPAGQNFRVYGISQLFYEFWVNYTGGETPPVSVVPLVFSYRMSAEVAATGTCPVCRGTVGVTLLLSDGITQEVLDAVRSSCEMYYPDLCPRDRMPAAASSCVRCRRARSGGSR